MAVSTSPFIRSFGLALDIDGTLLRGSTLLPNTVSSLLQLERENIPFILLTNSGGELEASRAAKLSKLLGMYISPKQVILGHTPFSNLVDDQGNLRYEPILVIGGGPNGEESRTIARTYGFENVFTPADIIAACSAIWPYPHNYTSNSVRQLPPTLKFRAILIFNTPLDWGPVLQIIMELLLSSGGQLGTQSSKNGDTGLPNSGYLQDDQPQLYFSNSDVSWTSEYPVPRFGLGTFKVRT